MSDWGPGASEANLSQASESNSEAIEENSALSPSEEEEIEEESAEELREDSERYTHPDLRIFEQAGGDGAEWRDGTVMDAIDEGEYGFLPVFGFNESNIAAKKYQEEHNVDHGGINVDDTPMEIGGKELSWWEDESIMPKHPYILVNPMGFTYVKPKFYDFRETFRFRKGDQFLFADSGGYQMMTQEEAEIVEDKDSVDFKRYKINPEALLDWQVANADAGATLDFPPYNISGDSAFPDAISDTGDWREFFARRKDKSGDMTLRMATRLSELRESGDHQANDFIFAPVIHGKPDASRKTEDLIRDWHMTMRNMAAMADIEPRGWVLKPEPASNFGQVALHLGFAAEYLEDAEYLHILMVGGLLQKTLIQYYAMHSDQFVTSDASSYAAGGKRRQFDLPKTATRRAVIISDRSEEEENAAMNPTRLDRHPCRCQVCSIVGDEVGFEFISEGSGSARSVTLNLHNLQQSLMIERTLDALLREEETQIVETGGEPKGCEFWRYVRSMGRDDRIEDLYRAMDYVRIAIEDGLDAANDVYHIKWQKSNGSTITRGKPGSASEGDW